MSEYVESLEKENEGLRQRLLHSYWGRNSINSQYSSSCHDEGIRGNCGYSCPVFTSGDCEMGDEIVDSLKELIDLYQDEDSTDES